MSTGRTILLVHQDASLLLTRGAILQAHGYGVEMASGREEAVAKCEQCALAVVDAQADPAAAIELCEELKRQKPEIKVALMIEYYVYLPSTDCPDELITRQAGPEAFVEKVERLLAE